MNQVQVNAGQSLTRRGKAAIFGTPLGHIARNAGILLATTLAVNAVTLPFIGFLARRLGVEGFGTYSVAFTVVSIAVMVLDMGTGKLLTRELSAQPARGAAIVGAALIPKPVLTGLALVAVGGGGALAGASAAQIATLGLAVLIAALMALAVAARAVFHAAQRMEYDSAGLAAERIITIAGSVAAVLAGYGLAGVLVAAVLGNLTDAGVSWFLVRKQFVPRIVRPSTAQTWATLHLGFPLFVTALFSTLYLRANVLILGWTAGSAAAGTFNAAFQMLALALFVPQMLGISIFPYFSRLALGNPTQLLRACRRGGQIMAGAGAACAAGLILGAGWLIPVLYGEHFLPAVAVLQILAVSLPFTFLATMLQQALVATNRQGSVGRATVLAAGANITLNLLLAPVLGIRGTALVAVGTEVLMALQYIVALRKAAPGAPQEAIS